MKRKTFFQFTTPSLLLMLLLMVFPLLTAAWLSLHFVTFRNLTTPEFIGLRNYVEVLGDARFWQSLLFTLQFIAITVPLQIALGFAIALLLDQVGKRMRGFYFSALLLPYIVVPVVSTLMFRQLFDPSGLMNWVLRNLLGIRFFYSEASVKTLIMVHGVWYATPFALIVLFAGLQTLPLEQLEAAAIDGANRLQQIRHVTLPHLSSLFSFVALIGIMDAYRVFDSVFVLSQQNPIYRAETLMVYNFQVALVFQRIGTANAMAILTVIGLLIVLIPFLLRTYREQTRGY